MTVFQAVEARQVCSGFGGNQSEVEWQTVLHERDLHAFDDGSFVLEHLDCQLLDVSITIVQLLNIEFVEYTDPQAFQ